MSTVVVVAMSVGSRDNECGGMKTRGEEERVVRKAVAASL